MPDLFARVVPIVKSALPGSRRDPRVTGLRRGARIAVTGWVLCVIPLLLYTMGYLPGAGTLYIAARLARRIVAVGRRWSAGRPVRRRMAAVVGLAVMAALAAFWITQGQFRGW